MTNTDIARSTASHYPFRGDVVGSFLRPAPLVEARRRHAAGVLSAEGLRAVEDTEIDRLLARQREEGLRAATDGEFRRSWWHLDFFDGLDGVEVVDLAQGIQFQGVQTRSRGLQVVGPVRFSDDHPFLSHFAYVRDAAERQGSVPKFTIPAPTILDFRLDPALLDKKIYDDHIAMEDDLVATYRAAIDAFYAAGARYLQFDDTAWGYICSPEELAKARSRGTQVDGIADRYARLLNRILEDRPADLTITTHVCRGNFRSTWIASGGYEPVAEQLLAGTDYDGYFLEYDTERAGGFEPLRHLPAGDKVVVLGLLTTKSGDLEDAAAVTARIDEATRFAPLEQLALSPQCGFASTEEGNSLTEEQQWAKIRTVVDVAAEVWR